MTKDYLFFLVYRALVKHCAARDDEFGLQQFLAAFRKDTPPSEYRIQGALGFGGKFRYPAFRVDCYPEDSTPERLRLIGQANEALAALREAFASAV